MNNKLVTVAQFSHVVEAQMAQNFLKNNQIESVISDEHIVSVNWLFSNLVGGVKLKVAEEDFAAAEKILQNASASDYAELAEESGLKCPQCSSYTSKLVPSANKGWAMLVLCLIYIPLPFLVREQWQCQKCGNLWFYRSPRNLLQYLIPIIAVIGLIAIVRFFSIVFTGN
jgi:hypothetical protein